MVGGKGGGGADAGPMLEYGDKALALQEKIYNQTRDDSQPWYQAGTSAVGKLQDLLGLQGGSNKSRDQLYESLKPKYTTTSTTQATPAGSDGMYRNDRGQVINLTPEEYARYEQGQSNQGSWVGLTPLQKAQSAQSTSSLDEAGLNSAVEAALSSQGTPEGYGSLLQGFDMSKFQADPGYQFRLQEGNKALERKLNASGKTYSPEAAKALLEYNQNMGSNEYGNAYNRYNIDQDNVFNRLATISGFGQTASGQLANAGLNYANQGTELYTGMGNSIAAANQANQSRNSSMFNTLLGAGAQVGSAYLMSDRRLKENIEHVGEENGFPIYRFNYINIPEKTYIGVMAQDVIEVMPEAIREVEGYMTVNYPMIGIQMRECVTCH